MGSMVWVLLGLFGLALVGSWWLLYQMLRQQGRLLLRIDALERGADASGVQSAPNGRPDGLPLASLVPPFRLPDLGGNEVALEDFRGRRVLLVNWDPGCGFCQRIAPELATLQGDLRTHKTELVLVSRRDAESNRRLAEEHGLDCAILLQSDAESLPAFGQLGTPVAYLLDEKGRVAKPLALGAKEVPELAQAAAGKKKLRTERSLAESRLEREGLKRGTPAPGFTLPDLEGRTVALREYRGRRVLLVFSDPDCGPCGALVHDLVRFHRDHGDDGLALIMVSRGEVEENRRKSAQYGIDFPVVVQRGWSVSKEYGIFATPVAFLVNEEGVVETGVARGPDEVMQLARAGLGAGKEAPLAEV
jgi:peroxiredoxin